MYIHRLHPFDLSPAQARAVQKQLAGSVKLQDTFTEVRTIAGVDVSTKGDQACAAVVVLSYPSLAVIDQVTHHTAITFPYIPGLLSFRELPVIIPAFEQLATPVDMVIVDGQGIAHPRGLGIAAHLGLLLGVPTIGCGKSRLYGQHCDPGPEKGSYENLYAHGTVIGAVVRTRTNIKPVYVSPGNNISIGSSIEYVLSCCTRYRLPEPTRQAHITAGECMRSGTVTGDK